MGSQIILINMEETTLCSILGRHVGQEINGGQLGLLARRYEHDDGLGRGVLDDGVVGGLHHGDETRSCVGDVEALCANEGVGYGEVKEMAKDKHTW